MTPVNPGKMQVWTRQVHLYTGGTTDTEGYTLINPWIVQGSIVITKMWASCGTIRDHAQTWVSHICRLLRMRGGKIYQVPGHLYSSGCLKRRSDLFGDMASSRQPQGEGTEKYTLDPISSLPYPIWALHWPKSHGRAQESTDVIHTGQPPGADSRVEMPASESCGADTVVKCPLHYYIAYTFKILIAVFQSKIHIIFSVCVYI